MASSAIESAMATGNWKGGATGVTQMLNTNNVLATQLILKPLWLHNEADRYVHPHMVFVLLSETPEEKNAGLCIT